MGARGLTELHSGPCARATRAPGMQPHRRDGLSSPQLAASLSSGPHPKAGHRQKQTESDQEAGTAEDWRRRRAAKLGHLVTRACPGPPKLVGSGRFEGSSTPTRKGGSSDSSTTEPSRKAPVLKSSSTTPPGWTTTVLPASSTFRTAIRSLTLSFSPFPLMSPPSGISTPRAGRDPGPGHSRRALPGRKRTARPGHVERRDRGSVGLPRVITARARIHVGERNVEEDVEEALDGKRLAIEKRRVDGGYAKRVGRIGAHPTEACRSGWDSTR